MSICLNMIVKNEEENITETLVNLVSHIKFDYWVISDTGSTDNTIELIKTFFKNIPGELHQDKWEDFGTNRTKALEYAFGKTDYLFIFDADDKIEGTFHIPPLTCDKYMCSFGPCVKYVRPLLVSNRKKWRFVGVLHEYIDCVEPHTTGVIKGDYYIVSGRTGNRNKNPNKYIDDANILAKAFETEKNVSLSARYAFYCAQSYRDASKKKESIEWYKKVLGLTNWAQEKYVSCIQIGTLTSDKDEAVFYFLKSLEYDSERMEGVVFAMEHYNKVGNHLLVNLLYNKFKNYKDVDASTKLFLYQDVYSCLIMDYYNSLSAYHTDDKESGYESCKKIIMSSSKYTTSAFLNLRLYEKYLDSKELLFRLTTFLKTFKESQAELLNLWSFLYKLALPHITTLNVQTVNKIRPLLNTHPRIFLSYRHTGSIDNFKNTIHSILNTWLDVDKIEYWFCVSDLKENRSEITKYKWINRSFENDAMSCITKKVGELKPTYWIHVENAIFYENMNYVIEEKTRINFVKNSDAFFITPTNVKNKSQRQWPDEVCFTLK